MSLNHSPSIITDGLAFYYDMYNKKSWKGRPIINQYKLPNDDINGFEVQAYTFYRVRSGNYGGYDITPNDYVWKYNISTNECPYHGNDVTITSGQVATFSFDYYIDPSVTNYPQNNVLASFEGVLSGNFSDPTPNIVGVWKRAVFSATAGGTGMCRMLLYPGGCGARLADSGFILYKNPQVEFDAPGNIPSPFVAGTRSNTQSILDLTNSNVITANGLTYSSDGSFSFNGTGDFISLPSCNLQQNFTLACWANITGDVSGLFGQGVYGVGQGLHVLWNMQGNRGMIFGMYANDLDTPSYTLTYNMWHYFVFTYNNSTYNKEFYADAVLVNSGIGSAYTGAGQFNIGAIYSAAYSTAKGKIPIVKIYNRILSASEIKQNFNAMKGRFIP